jgi:hypothetical protein
LTATDKLGTPLAVGDFIVYGHALGRCAALRIGRILNITEKKVESFYVKGDFKTEWSIRVCHLEDDWDGNPQKPGPRTGCLMYPKRTIVLRPEMLSWEMRDMLESFIP